MTIHHSHPFAEPEGSRDQVRRLRGRLAAPVTIWATGDGRTRVGLTVSSMLLAAGEPAEVVGLIDPDSDLGERIEPGTTLSISVLAAGQEFLAGVFAGTEPSPGGPFRTGHWIQTPWGPRLDGASAWLGVRVADKDEQKAGWSRVVHATVEDFTLSDVAALTLHRGSMRAFDNDVSASDR